MLKFLNVNKSFSNKTGRKINALDNINLTIKQGSIYGIIGTSGAGKSTLLRMANKLEKPDSGEIWTNLNNSNVLLNNLNTFELKLLRQQTSMIFQHFNLLESYTVRQNILFPLKLNGQLKQLSKQEIESKLQPIIELTGLTHHIDNYPSQLSGGQKQRVAIARAIITEPKLLLCDECTSALDPETTDSILQLLKTINKKFNLTILLITHEMGVIKKICDEAAVMSHGKIVEAGSVIDLYINGQHDITKKLLKQNLLKKLPSVLNSKFYDSDNLLVELTFSHHTASEPILSELSNELDINFNILQGEIETIQNQIVGRMLVLFEDASNYTDYLNNYFSNKHIHFEIITDHK